jgi:hypothetical protein
VRPALQPEVIEGSLSLSIGVRISTAGTKIHEEIERHPGWFLVLLVLTVASSIVGVVFVGIVGTLGLALGVLRYVVGRRAESLCGRSSAVRRAPVVRQFAPVLSGL